MRNRKINGSHQDLLAMHSEIVWAQLTIIRTILYGTGQGDTGRGRQKNKWPSWQPLGWQRAKMAKAGCNIVKDTYSQLELRNDDDNNHMSSEHVSWLLD